MKTETRNTTRVTPPVIRDTSVIPLFKDTARTNVLAPEGRTFTLDSAGQRQSLRALLARERRLWNAVKPGAYRFLLKASCFCPGNLGWLVIDVSGTKPVRAWDRTGKSVGLVDWSTFSIDQLFDNLERTVENSGRVQIAFDERWHFPRYVYTAALRVPDSWGIIESRALRPR